MATLGPLGLYRMPPDENIRNEHALILKMLIKIYGGFYGPFEVRALLARFERDGDRRWNGTTGWRNG